MGRVDYSKSSLKSTRKVIAEIQKYAQREATTVPTTDIIPWV